MKQPSIFKLKRIPILLLAALLFVSACAAQSQSPRIDETTSIAQALSTAIKQTASTAQPQLPAVEEIVFQSGEFTLVGDLRLPEGDGPFPVVLFVHGSEEVGDRIGSGGFLPIMDRMLQAGYATFAFNCPAARNTSLLQIIGLVTGLGLLAVAVRLLVRFVLRYRRSKRAEVFTV